MPDIIITDKQLFSSAYTATINVPIEKFDIAEWLFNLPEAEYQRCCPPDHISAATTSTDDGKRMSINVEMIGQTLMVQHYVADVATPTLCKMVSTSDAFTPNGRTRVQVIWTLSIKKIDENTCEYTTAWRRIRRTNSSSSSPSTAPRLRTRPRHASATVANTQPRDAAVRCQHRASRAGESSGRAGLRVQTRPAG